MSMESDEPKFKKSAWGRLHIIVMVVVVFVALALGIGIGYIIGNNQKDSPNPVPKPTEAAQSEAQRFVVYINSLFWLFLRFELSSIVINLTVGFVFMGKCFAYKLVVLLSFCFYVVLVLSKFGSYCNINIVIVMLLGNIKSSMNIVLFLNRSDVKRTQTYS